MVVACMLEADAATFVPLTVAGAWIALQQDNTAAGHGSATSAAGHESDNTLVHYCRVLEDLDGFFKAARLQRGNEAQKKFSSGQQNLIEIKVDVHKLKKARTLWRKMDPDKSLERSLLPEAEQAIALANLLAEIFPETVAVFDAEMGRWYAGGHRVRGKELETIVGKTKVLFFNAKPEQWVKKQDHSMTCLKPLICLPIRVDWEVVSERVVVISDSTLQLPGVMYGLSCELRKFGVHLIWLVSKSGAGAEELRDAWRDAPRCHWGLTVMNMNDGMKHEPWGLSDEDLEHVKELGGVAASKCETRHEVFINDAGFYPDLRPSVYPELAQSGTEFLRTCGVRVHDGK